MIDLYCERTAPGLFQEPYNTLSNLAFLIAALVLAVRSRRDGNGTSQTRILIALVALVGIGSATFHIFATLWSQIFDIVPILLFQLLYIWFYLRDRTSVSKGASILMITGFALACGVGTRFEMLNGSVAYTPSVLVLLGLGLHHARAAGRTELLLCALLFGVALVFRITDHAFCETIPMGTHFLWHAVNAIVLFLAVVALSLK